MNRALGYIRVSKAREEMISPELQLAAITDWCVRNNTALIDTITDLDATGRNFARAGVQTLIERIEAGEADTVVVWKWSRFGRNVRDCLVNIDRLEIAGGRLVAATEDFDDSPVGRFGRGQFLLMAQFESERIGEQWKEAQARRLRQGVPHNGSPRYGYRLENGQYQIDPDTGPILAQMYRRYIAGHSFPALVRWLNDSSIPSPEGGIWWVNPILRMLDRGFGAGYIWSKGEFHPGVHPSIITAQEWEDYQRARRTRSKLARRHITPTHPYAGLARCRACGYAMIRMTRDKRTFLRCNGSMQATNRCLIPAYIPMPEMDAAVFDWLAGLAREIDAAVVELPKPRRESDVPRLTRRVIKLENSLARLTRTLADGQISPQAYTLTASTLEVDLELARNALQKAQDETESLTRALPTLSPDLASDWPTLDILGQREILASLVRVISVRSRRLDDGSSRVLIVPNWT